MRGQYSLNISWRASQILNLEMVQASKDSPTWIY